MNEIADAFLGDSALKHTMCVLCNGRDQLCTDPISETLIVMHTSPVSVMLTDTGVILFRTHPMMVVPYTSMDKAQLKLLESFVQQFLAAKGGECGGHGEIRGGYIAVPPLTGKPGRHVPLQTIVNTFIELVKENQSYDAWSKRAICSVVLQRLGASIGASAEVLRMANSRVTTAFC